MNSSLYFDDLQVGNRWQSRARTITETDVVGFAGLTGDYDPLHVDHEFVKQTPFGKPIAHGLLGLSWVAGLGSHFPAVHTVAFVAVRNWEFLRPAFIGDTVHAINEITELRDGGRRRGVVLWNRQLVNQRGEVLQKGVFETLVARKPDLAEVPPPAVKTAVPKAAVPKPAVPSAAPIKPEKKSPAKPPKADVKAVTKGAEPASRRKTAAAKSARGKRTPRRRRR